MEAFIEKFGINWKLIAAQAVNFFILFFLLAKFVYRPVVELLNKRRERIEQGLTLTDEAEKKIADIDKERVIVLIQAEQESQKIIQRGNELGIAKEKDIIKTAEQSAEKIVVMARQQTEQERIAMRDEVYKESAVFLKQALGKILGSSEFSDQEDRVVALALKELKS